MIDRYIQMAHIQKMVKVKEKSSVIDTKPCVGGYQHKVRLVQRRTDSTTTSSSHILSIHVSASMISTHGHSANSKGVHRR